MKKKVKKSASLTKTKKSGKKPQLGAAHAEDQLVKRVLFRPERYQYVRGQTQSVACVFCTSAELPLGFDSLCVFKTTLSQVLVNKFPYNSGHLLVLPIQHHGDLTLLSDEQYADLHLVLKKSLTALQTLYQPQAVNIGMNLGKVAGAGLPDHLHYHLVPRWAGDLNFFPLIAETKVVVETLNETYDRFRQYFDQRS